MDLSSANVTTVRGDVPSEALGLVHAHEHLIARIPAELAARDGDLALDAEDPVLEDLAAFRAAGGGTIVEMTTVDYGRDVAALRRLSQRSGVHVIAATGFNKDVYCAPLCDGADPDEVSRTQVGEILHGVGDSGIRCGVVKLATSRDEATPAERTAIRAAARTHLQTGCPIFTHTEAGTFAHEQLELLAAEGVPPSAVTLGHLDRNPDLGLHRELARAGAFVSYDHVPKPKYATEAAAIELIVALAGEGLGGQVVVGGDFARRSMFTGWGGAPGLTYIVTTFAARLRAAADAAGVDGEDLVDAVLRRNPQRALSFRATAEA